MLTFLAGLLTGIILSAPVGPMGAIAVYQAGTGHARAARMLATGACLADALLAGVASFGVRIPLDDAYFNAGVVLLMAAMGIYLLATAKKPSVMPNASASIGFGFISTLMHPANLIVFASIFGWLHNQGLTFDGLLNRITLIAGVLCGAMGLWFGLIALTQRMSGKLAMERCQVYLKLGLAVLCLAIAGWAAWDMARGIAL